jgi:hypothetical protein
MSKTDTEMIDFIYGASLSHTAGDTEAYMAARVRAANFELLLEIRRKLVTLQEEVREMKAIYSLAKKPDSMPVRMSNEYKENVLKGGKHENKR